MLKNSSLMHNFTQLQLLDILFGLLLLFLDNYENLAIATTTSPSVTPPPHRGAARQMYGSGSLRPPGSNPNAYNQNQRKLVRKITPSPSTMTPQLGYELPRPHYPQIFRLPIHVEDFIRNTLMRPPNRGERMRSGGLYGQRLEYHEGKPRPLYDFEMGLYKGRGFSPVQDNFRHHSTNYMEDPGLDIGGLEDTYDNCNIDCDGFLCRRDCTCIPQSSRCDDTPDCIGNEDETDCQGIHNTNCEQSENSIRCPISRKCIPKKYLCDGDDDCGDFSDETHCGPQVNCTADQFECNNGLCIPESWLCDNDNDCVDFSDELNCTKSTCSEDEFSCADGTCISKNFKCDRRVDCSDKSDEEDCDIEPAKCNEDEFQCAFEKCIKAEFKCDGDNDCGDWSDENDCVKLRRSCESGEIKCNNGKCIPKRWKCDKQFDCDEKEDEANCDSNTKRTCAPDEFVCNNGECILGTWVCDGSPDCNDNEDENKCKIVCDDEKFGCSGADANDTSIKYCINKKHVCDGQNDCPKGDDEKNCSEPRECEKDTNCTQLCVTTVDQRKACSCYRGYKLALDGTSCDDVNECLYATDPVCSQTCTNTIGSYTCGCMTGYILRPDMRTCKALGAPPTLLFANRMDIRQVSLSNHQYTAILRGLHNAIALDYHYNESLIFWSDITLDVIKKAYLNGTETTDVIKWGLESPSGIALDWIHNLLFWTDSGTRRIEVATLDGKQRAIVTADDVDKPRAIAVHPGMALVFWTDWGPRPKIERSEMDGKNRRSIITESLFWPNGLTIDYTTKRIYWADAKHNVIETASFDGSDRRKVLTKGLPHPFALTIFEDAIYWTDWHTKSISTANKATGAGLRTIHSNLHFPMDIHSFHPQRQPPFKNHCGPNNGGCSHLCLPNAQSYSCVCRMGLKLNADGRTCQSPSKMLIFARKRDLRIKHIDNSGDEHYIVIPVDGVKSAVALDWDSKKESIFWTDVGRNTINKAHWNGSNHEILVSTNLKSPAGLAFDWITDKLYWTDSETLRIEVSNLDGSIRSLLIWNNLDKPRDIVLDPIHGHMYWSDWGDIPKIERANMDGKQRTTIISQNLTWPNGLAIDHETSQLFWTDGGTRSISVANLDGSNRRVLLEGTDLPHPFGLDVYENHVYWTDWKTSNIERINKKGGNRTVISTGLNNLMDIRIFHKDRKFIQTPCNKNNGGCSHLCLLTPNNYTCSCPIGVMKKADGKTCENGPKTSLILAHRMDIRRISLDINYVVDVVLPFKQLKHVTSVDVDKKTGEIYWTDSSEDIIQKSKADGGGVKTIMWHELQMAEAIAIDSAGRKIYWTDGGRNSIEVSELNGRNRRVLIWENVDTPRALALHYKNGVMFWSDWGSSPKIEIAHMDGTNRKAIINENLIWPNGLAIDRENSKLYWNDAKISVIQCSDFNGKNRRTVTKDVKHPYGLVVVGNYIYWTDWQTKALHRADKRNGNHKIDLVSNLEGLMDIRYVQTGDVEENACGTGNGGCSHLCLRTPKSYVCACPTGVPMIKENTCAYQPSNYVLFTSRAELVRISLDTEEMWDVTLPIRNVYHPIGIDFHWNKQLIFYSDREKKKIVSVNMKNMSETIDIITTNVSAPNGIALDWLADNLYWTDTNNKVIEVARLNGMYRKVVIGEYLQDPRSIAVFPRKGYLFWTDWGTNPKIERSSLNGSDRRIVISNDLEFPNGIVIDFKTKRLYWSDAKLDRIETSDLYGRNRIQLIQGMSTNKQSTHPFDLAISGDYVYWTDWFQKQIYRADKNSGKNMRAVKSNLEGAMGITVVSESRQSGWNPCAIDNGGCSHLCFYNTKNYTCECPDQPDEIPCRTEPLEGLIIKPPQNYEYENELEYDDDNLMEKIHDDDKLEQSASGTSTHFYIITLIPMCGIILISILIVVAAVHYRKGKKKFLYENGKSVMTFSNPNYYTSNNEPANQPVNVHDKKPFLWKRLKYDKSQERVYEEKADNASPEVVSLIPAVLTPCSSNCEAVTPEIERSPSVTPLHRIDAIQPVV